MRLNIEQTVHNWQTKHWLALGLIVLVALAFIAAPWSLMEKLQAIGYTICPQREAHSLFIAGMQLPLEARKVGIFGGFLSTLLVLLALGRGRSRRLPGPGVLAILILFVLSMVLDGINASFYDFGLPHLYAPDIRLRLITGLLNGVAATLLVLPVLNTFLWSEGDKTTKALGWREIALALALVALIFWAATANLAVFLYPLSLLSALGVLAMLSVMNLLLLTGIAKRGGQLRRRADLLPLLAGVLLVDGLELTALATLRLLLIGGAGSVM